MNPDNPYAAPQTLQLIANEGDQFPLAEEQQGQVPRDLFPELSTQALERIKIASSAIQRMTTLWTIALVLLLLGVVMVIFGKGPVHGYPLVLLACSIVLGFRIYAGVERGASLRYFSLVFDLLPALLMIYWSIQEFLPMLNKEPPVHQVMAILVDLTLLIVVNVIPFASVMAQLKYDCLFGDGRYLHQDMTKELIHRWYHRIS